MNKNELLSRLPSIEYLIKKLNNEGDIPHKIFVESARDIINEARNKILLQPDKNLSELNIENMILNRIKQKQQMSLRPVINATGVILHTNLGRAPLSKTAINNLTTIAQSYSNLEFDLKTGKRGSRYGHVEDLICKITGAESAIVVNNNAAAVNLVLSALVRDREVIISRGELVEVGGGFRIPDIMEQSGATLVEVGTTNRTYIYDYEKNINENTAALLKVHTSNYRIYGYTKSVSSGELVKLAREKGLIAIEDLGSGVLVDLSELGFDNEPTVNSIIRTDMDIVTFSGDKLLGGPQVGVIVGKKKYLDIIKKHPLNRAFRIDKLTLATFEATMKTYNNKENLLKDIPVLRMLTLSKEELYLRAKRLKGAILNKVSNIDVKITQDSSQVGGGALPTKELLTYVLMITSKDMKASQIEYKLRNRDFPIICRIKDDKIIFDIRTIFEDQINEIVSAIYEIFNNFSNKE